MKHKEDDIKYGFSQQFIFAKVMENENICIPFLERIFKGKKIKQIILTETSKVKSEVTFLNNSPEDKYIRVDVLFEDDDAWYDIEMQVSNEADIPKRSRYYRGTIDTQTLKAGSDYNTLKKSFVIFVCRFDPFGLGEDMYFFENYDVKKQLRLGDEAYTIILNTKSKKTDTNDEFKSLFEYIEDGKVNRQDKLIVSIHEEVKKLQKDPEVIKVMDLITDMKIKENRRVEKSRAEGRAEGLAEGRAEGRAEGEARVNKLTQLLLEENRQDDLLKAISDKAFQEELMNEYGL